MKPMCWVTDWGCQTREGVKGLLEGLANSVVEAVGAMLGGLGSVWVLLPTPSVTGGSGAQSVGSPVGLDRLNVVLGWVMWIGLAVAVLSIIALGARFALGRRHGGAGNLDRLGTVLVAVLLISSASVLVSALLPSSGVMTCPDPSLKGPDGSVIGCASPTVGFIQSSLWGYMGVAVVVSVVVAAIRMAWQQRAQPGKDLVRSLLTLLVVSGSGLAVISLLTSAADMFSVWILTSSLNCDVGGDSGCFGGGMAKVLVGLNTVSGGLGVLMVIVLGMIAILVGVVQMGLMVVRSAMLVLLAGVLPLTASATNTEMGQAWFKRSVSWLVAFLLYKPVAAIIYATSFKLVGEVWKSDSLNAMMATTMGIALMVMALVALPALMRFVTPLVGQTAGSGGGAGETVVGAVLPMGASAINRISASSLESGGGPSGSSGLSAPSGSSRPGSSSTTGGGSGRGSPGGASSGAAAGGGAGAASGGASAGGGAAIAGPVGVAAVVAQKGVEVAQGARQAVQQMVEDSAGGGA